MIEKIDDSNFLIFAMKFYDNNQCFSLQEFEEDLNRFLHVKKLLNRYLIKGELKDRLIINHLIVLFNLFGIATVDFLFHKLDKQYWNVLVTFLVYLDRMPDEIPSMGLKLTDFQLDQVVIQRLREL